MAVLSVHRHENHIQEENNHVKSNKLASVPVMLLIAMTPAMANAKTPVTAIPVNSGNLTETLTQIPSEETDALTYNMGIDRVQQSGYPFNIQYFRTKIIQQVKRAKANGQFTNIVLIGSPVDGRNNNAVREIFMINDGEELRGEIQRPTYITELVYHDLGANEFLGVITRKEVYDRQGRYKGAIQREYRLDDESAQFLLDFNAKATKWEDKTRIKYRETKSAELAPVITR